MAGSRVKRLPVSFKGRLTRIKVNGTIKKQYSYDEYGNPTDYAGEATLFLLMTKRRANRHTSP